MSILDPLQKQLAVDIWDERMKLRPELRKQILDKLFSVLDKNNIDGMYIIGTATGYQYTESSDIDINVSVREYDLSMRDAVNKINGFLSYGGRHPVMFNIKQNTGNEEMWQDAAFGVYNVLKDDWTKLPPPVESYRDPNIAYKQEIDYARIIAEDFNRRLEQFKRHLHSLTKIKKFKWIVPFLGNWFYKLRSSRLKEELIELARYAQALEDDRKFAYQWGWGVPRADFRNIVYKFLEHGPNGKLFLLLEKVDLPDEDVFGPTKEERRVQAMRLLEKTSMQLPPNPETYHNMKQEERLTKATSSSAYPAAAGAALGTALGYALHRNKVLKAVGKKLVGGALIGGTGGASANEISKLKARQDLKNPGTREKDYKKYEDIARKMLINQQL